ncbi:hypothetical protein AKJ16_DCAP07426 [Drosera capensis]
MPTTKPQGKYSSDQTTKPRRLPEKSKSFHSRRGSPSSPAQQQPHLRRMKTEPSDLNSIARFQPTMEMTLSPRIPRLTKLLINVTIQGSIGAVQVVLSPESSVEDLIAAAMRQYVREGRRPVLPSSVAAGFDLHYSQFSLESLRREEKLERLGSRNFFMCSRRVVATAESTTCCSKEVEKERKEAELPWLKFINFLHG